MPCIVSAHSSRTKLVIGQIKADEKSNEITAIPNLLDLLYLRGAIVTIDEYPPSYQEFLITRVIRKSELS